MHSAQLPIHLHAGHQVVMVRNYVSQQGCQPLILIVAGKNSS